MSKCNLLISASNKRSSDIHLRNVDLNLLTVFNAVMQVQNVTRAARSLGMSQPAVSNAVARLKVMFNDELFVRYGRGIRPTAKAHQLFGPVRQALQLVHNELPVADFDAKNSDRLFNLLICSPLDICLTSQIVDLVKQCAPQIQLIITSYLNDKTEHKLRHQEAEFVIGYTQFAQTDLQQQPLFNDELVLAVSEQHPRIQSSITQEQLFEEMHAVVSPDSVESFSTPYYENNKHLRKIAYQGTDMNSVLNLVSKTDLVAIAPRWLVKNYSHSLCLKLTKLPYVYTSRTCYLTWHKSANRDKGHQWMKTLLSQISVSH